MTGGLTAAALASIALFAFTMSVTPGPNNMLLATSGLRFGLRRTAPMIFGIQLGVIIQAGLVAAGLGSLFLDHPWLKVVLKVVGSGYLVWLAWHLWMSAALPDSQSARPARWWQMVVFQFINPKAWVMTVTLIAGFMPSDGVYVQNFAVTLLLFTIVGTPSCGVWAVFGSSLRTWLSCGNRLVWANRVFAVLTAATVGMLWV